MVKIASENAFKFSKLTTSEPPASRGPRLKGYNPKSLQNMKYNRIVPREQLPEEYKRLFGSLNIDPDLIDVIIPTEIVLLPEERVFFYRYIYLMLKDFEGEKLTSTDVDDIVGLSISRALEIRLLKLAKKGDANLLDITNALDKVNKRAESLKGNLASRRTDRIDVRNKDDFSILNLVAMFDGAERERLDAKISELLIEQKEVSDTLDKYRDEDYVG